MFDRTIRGDATSGAPHPVHHHPHPLSASRHGRRGRRFHDADQALSLESPGDRRMRGLGRGRDTDGPGRGHGGRGDHGHRGPRGPRGVRLQSRRGRIREAVLTLLAEAPMHGYQLMTELGERTGGRWRPSAGSIYPTLQQLEDEGLVTAQEQDGRRVFALTDQGRTVAAALDAARPWARGDDDGRDDLRSLSRELGIAAIQVARVGSPAANDAARAVLTEARRSLYRILADDAPAADDTTATA